MSGALLDARGCLTPAGIAALDRAPLGQGPPELAAHVVQCDRCRRRMLVRLREPARSRSRRRVPGAWLVLVGGLLLVVLGYFLGAWLTRR